MSYKNRFPRLVAPCRPRLSLSIAVFAIIIGLTSNSAFGQSRKSKPVARLITTYGSMPEEIAQARPVRVVPVASVSRASMAATGTTSMERRAFDLINAQRRANGFAPLVWDEELCRMARSLSNQMAGQNFFNHVTPEGRDMVERAHASGIMHWRALGENIAYNQGFDDPAGFAVERWMNSAKHRDNIMNGYFTRSAIGVARSSDGRIFFTQVFITR